MSVSHFMRFKGGFGYPTEDGSHEDLESILNEPALFLSEELKKQGIKCSLPEWGGYDYEMRCPVGDREYRVSLCFDYVRWEWFEVSYVPTLGFLAKLLGNDETEEMEKLSKSISAAFESRSGITDIRWYEKPLGNPEVGYAPSPVTP